MTKVTMIAEISGTRDGAAWPKRGEQIDVPADEAAMLLANRLAKKPDSADKKAAKADGPEVSAPPEPETATTASARTRGRGSSK